MTNSSPTRSSSDVLEVKSFSVQKGNARRRQRRGGDKLESQPIGNVPALLRRSRPAETAQAAARLLASAAAEQSFEYIPEVRALAADFMGGSTRSPGTKAAAATTATADWRRRLSVALNFAPAALRTLVFVPPGVIGVRPLTRCLHRESDVKGT